ncbi:MAG: hypothetical protein KAW88_00425 [Candidatus Cloacimonetes bacterium]|nr:hypothetical protein [Candidatus Cloacimonadota bacterium]
MKNLNLLVISKLIEPLSNAKNNLEVIRTKTKNSDPVILNGLFTMCLAYFEYSLSDTLSYYLKCFPQKLDFRTLNFSNIDQSFMKSNLSFSKEDIFNTDLIELEIEKKIDALNYSSIQNYMKNIFSIFSINVDDTDLLLDKLIEFKETRNILIHNNLIINYKYLEKTGSIKRGKLGETLKIDSDYIDGCLDYLSKMINLIIDKLKQKYKDFTRLKVLEDLWNYMFKSPVMKFDDYWQLDKKNDRIICMTRTEDKYELSSGETMLLSVWRAHYAGNSSMIKNFSMYNLDNRNQKKLLYFLSILNFIDLETIRRM